MPSRLPSAKEQLVLELLAEKGSLYGLELVTLSGGGLKRGTVYVTLSRMQDRGLVRPVDDKAPGSHAGLPRPRYRITAAGERALLAAQAVQGLLQPVRRGT